MGLKDCKDLVKIGEKELGTHILSPVNCWSPSGKPAGQLFVKSEKQDVWFNWLTWQGSWQGAMAQEHWLLGHSFGTHWWCRLAWVIWLFCGARTCGAGCESRYEWRGHIESSHPQEVFSEISLFSFYVEWTHTSFLCQNVKGAAYGSGVCPSWVLLSVRKSHDTSLLFIRLAFLVWLGCI